jgi:hypothetical protein
MLPDGIRPDDRVLILGVPEPAYVAALARAVARGLLVAIGKREAIYDARKAARDFDNVLFVPGTPEELPWRDGFFTRVVDLTGEWPDPERVRREIQRVTVGAATPSNHR